MQLSGQLIIIWKSFYKHRAIFPLLNLATVRGAKEKIKETLARLIKSDLPAQTQCNPLRNYIAIWSFFSVGSWGSYCSI